MKTRSGVLLSLAVCFLISIFLFFVSTQNSYAIDDTLSQSSRVLNLNPTHIYCDTDNATIGNDTLKTVECTDRELRRYFEQRGDFYVFYNFIKALNSYKCHETITLTSPGDFRFLDNVIPLVNRWDGPISIALYSPGDDFFTTLQAVAYLRVCGGVQVVERVTFSLFFDVQHVPTQQNAKIPLQDAYKDAYDCSKPPPWQTINDEDTYKAKNSLLYPINVARNVARVSVQTHFIFPSDIELYPTYDFVKKFLEMVSKKPELFKKKSRNVFVLPVFEILADHEIPENKTILQNMLSKKTAFLFHQKVCDVCHKIPKYDEWVKAEETEDLGVFVTGKRQGKQLVWEPFFICTTEAPLWDERLSWEGQGNKMCQAFALCVMDYDFNVLDNVFLIHKPGVKKKKVQNIKHRDQQKINNKILKGIQDDLFRVYGKNDKCRIFYV